ncbi:Diacylglycerol kinase theta [Bienertia sinuspersici]
MYRRSSFRNSTTNSSLNIKRSTAAPKPISASTPPLPLLPSNPSTKLTQTSHSHSHSRGSDEHDLQVTIHKKATEPVIEFPVSPDADAVLVGEGITNSNHPQHRMVHVNLPNPFICMGCKEYGAGSRFTCQQCNFELHDFCALAPPVLKAHPLHSQHQLVFNPKPGKGGFLRSKCDLCGKSTKGYIFNCSACNFQLHPCCAMLSGKMNFPIHPHSLVILPTTANSGGAGDMLCSECERRRSGRVYQCTVCNYYLHAVCAKRMVNGLHANGIKGLENAKPSMFGVAAKIASHVVVGFMGGIVEGIGEGLGEALTQNFLKGTSSSNTRRSSHPRYPGN